MASLHFLSGYIQTNINAKTSISYLIYGNENKKNYLESEKKTIPWKLENLAINEPKQRFITPTKVQLNFSLLEKAGHNWEGPADLTSLY